MFYVRKSQREQMTLGDGAGSELYVRQLSLNAPHLDLLSRSDRYVLFLIYCFIVCETAKVP